MGKKPVIFTDLDGTLLSHEDYSFDMARPALKSLEEKGIPLVICSSKTRAEIESYREKLHNRDPFVSENGGGVFIPKGYFPSGLQDIEYEPEEKGELIVLRLGAGYDDLRREMRSLRSRGFRVKGFGDMGVDEVAFLTGLDKTEARMAVMREFDEPFVTDNNEAVSKDLVDAIIGDGYRYTVGRLSHLMGASDKGKAVEILKGLYRKKYGDIVTVALGDSPNDIPMLKSVDMPVLVQRPDGSYDARIELPGLTMAEGPGPDGWNKAVNLLLERL